ncbi:hypothetical protein, partial [Klebsiella pneumoniae]|uniref:hypothetical protein n=1 Tax=Klebsiella pneumoniae TaxID=573 RepID=UPI001F4AB7B6
PPFFPPKDSNQHHYKQRTAFPKIHPKKTPLPPAPFRQVCKKSCPRQSPVFVSGHPREFLNLPKNLQISERSSPLQIPTPHAKLKFCRFLIYKNGLMKNKCALMCYKVQIQVVDDSM